MGGVRTERLLTALAAPLIGVLAALLLVLGAAPGAVAHSELVSSDPQDGASIEQMPGSVTLTFNEDIDPNFAQVVVADAQDVARPVTVTVDGPRVTLPVPAEVPAGRVEVRYRVVSADGHPVGGEIAFTVTNGGLTTAASSTTAASPTAAPTTAAPGGTDSTGTDTTAADTTPASVNGEGSTMWMYALTGFAALLVVAAGVVIVLMGRRRR